MSDVLPGNATRAARRAAALLFAIAVAFQIASLSRHLTNIYDEGLILLGAQRILEGEVPYRDFWGMYGPGQFYAVAALFKLFGSTVLVEQLWDVAIRAGITAMAFLWARRLGAGVCAYVAWAVVLVLLSGFGSHGFPVMHALMFVLVSAWLVLGAIERERPARRLFAAGACAGIAALFRHDMGFYTVAAEALFLLWWAPRRIVGSLAPLALGAGLVVGAAAIFLLAQMPARDLWFNLFVVPGTIYPRVRWLPWPPLPDPRAMFSGPHAIRAFNDGVDAYLPLAVCAVALASVAFSRTEPLRRAGMVLLVLLTLALYLKGLVRTHNIHTIQSVIPAVVLAFVLIARVRGRIVQLALGVAVTVPLIWMPAGIVIATIRKNVATLRTVHKEIGLRLGMPHLCAAAPGLERARCFLPPPDDSRIALLVQSLTRPNEPVYVGPSRHDRIFLNNLLLQYLMARPAATRWHESHPGIQTTEPIQREMIAEFTARNVRVLVLSAEWEDIREPNESALSSGVTLLDDYIKANFEETDKFGAVSVWRRKPASGE